MMTPPPPRSVCPRRVVRMSELHVVDPEPVFSLPAPLPLRAIESRASMLSYVSGAMSVGGPNPDEDEGEGEGALSADRSDGEEL